MMTREKLFPFRWKIFSSIHIYHGSDEVFFSIFVFSFPSSLSLFLRSIVRYECMNLVTIEIQLFCYLFFRRDFFDGWQSMINIKFFFACKRAIKLNHNELLKSFISLRCFSFLASFLLAARILGHLPKANPSGFIFSRQHHLSIEYQSDRNLIESYGELIDMPVAPGTCGPFAEPFPIFTVFSSLFESREAKDHKIPFDEREN